MLIWLKKWNIINHKTLSPHIKMSKEIITFSDIEIEKTSFTAIKVLFLEDLDIDNALVTKKISSGEKNYEYFIGDLYDDYKINPLHIMPPKARTYVKGFDDHTKWMFFFDWRWWLIGKI